MIDYDISYPQMQVLCSPAALPVKGRPHPRSPAGKGTNIPYTRTIFLLLCFYTKTTL